MCKFLPKINIKIQTLHKSQSHLFLMETVEKTLLDLFWCLIDSHVRIWSADDHPNSSSVTLMIRWDWPNSIWASHLCNINICVWIKNKKARNNTTKATNSSVVIVDCFWDVLTYESQSQVSSSTSVFVRWSFTALHPSITRGISVSVCVTLTGFICVDFLGGFRSLSSDGSVALIALQ